MPCRWLNDPLTATPVPVPSSLYCCHMVKARQVAAGSSQQHPSVNERGKILGGGDRRRRWWWSRDLLPATLTDSNVVANCRGRLISFSLSDSDRSTLAFGRRVDHVFSVGCVLLAAAAATARLRTTGWSQKPPNEIETMWSTSSERRLCASYLLLSST